MKKCHVFILSAILCLIITAPLSGCGIAKKISSSSSGSYEASEPLTGRWSMKRTSYQPALPPAVPEILVNQVFPASPKWKISLSNGSLIITYDGRNTWFNPVGFDVQTKAVTVTENADKKGATFKGGGIVSADRLPGALAIVGTVSGGLEDIQVVYSDTVSITMTSSKHITATITYTANGTYTMGNSNEKFNYGGSLNFTGTK